MGNVIGDALNRTRDGGRIAIKAAMEDGEFVAISIAGDGIGIDAADHPRIFDRFYRTGRSRSPGIGDTVREVRHHARTALEGILYLPLGHPVVHPGLGEDVGWVVSVVAQLAPQLGDDDPHGRTPPPR